jgi:molybdate transport system ATP-binding protein
VKLDLDLRLERPGFAFHAQHQGTLSGLTAIFGPSGSGKTTLLRLIAGFERGAGEIGLGPHRWQQGRHFVPPHRRRIATVFQEARLFQHLDVAGNLAYAARRAGTAHNVASLADRFGVTQLMGRRVAGLSGGEAQRVSLVRALLTDPVLILMDEPLSALDGAARAGILSIIEDLRDEGPAPILYVTHSRSEVARLADRVMLVASGAIRSEGPASAILPQILQTERDELSVMTVTHTGVEADGLCVLAYPGGRLLVPDFAGQRGRPTRIAIHARDVLLARGDAADWSGRLSALNAIPARVFAIEVRGASARVTLDCAGTQIVARITARSAGALGLASGVDCLALIKSVALLED